MQTATRKRNVLDTALALLRGIAQDDEEWRTSEGGKHYEVDTETGKITKGNIGQKKFKPEYREIESTKPDTARYDALLQEYGGEYQKAAKAYFDEKLKGKYVKAPIGNGQTADAHFTGGTWKEVKQNLNSDAVKAALVPHMPDIIQTGEHRKNASFKQRQDDAVAFHEYKKIVQTSEGPREAIVDVAERPNREPNHMVYNLSREGTENYARRQSWNPGGTKKENGSDSVSSGPFPIMRTKAVSYDANIESFFEIVNVRWANERSGITADSSRHLALDRNSVRTKDENGYLHVKSSHISKATVNPYYGKEIPGWREEGLEPDKIYYGLRDPEELEKSVPTWAGLPLHIEHHIDSAEDPQKLTRVGTVGTEIVWNDPYLDAPLTIWDQNAIDGIEDDSFRELSCAYRYEPDFTPGAWNGRHYDFVMRNIRGNHVALVEEGRAGSDVLVADAKPDALRKRDIIDMALDILRKAAEDLKNKEGQVPKPANTNSLKEGLMSRFRKWFGAQNSEPAPKEEKVDLVQAILDLHRHDPKTGELREDVQEDADKVAELKVLVEGLRGKLPPEDLERLIDAVGALAEAEEVGDEDPLQKKEEEVENVHADAMRKAGCDAEDPDEARAFAGGVAYGEELERNPAERAKLDREHESEGMQKAMDRCGVDAENPAETRAFAEGVKYGEEAERAKAEAKDAEPEKEPEQKDENPAEVGKDEDKDAMIKKILAAVPDLTEEQKKKITDTLQDLAYAPATGDEDLAKKVEGAADRALKKRRFLGAVDAARIRAQATKDAMDRMRQIADACRVVRPLVGEMDALGFDSANDVYGYTLEQLGKDPLKYDRKAWRGMVAMLLDGQAALARDSKPAINSKPIPDSGPFRFLKNITISG